MSLFKILHAADIVIYKYSLENVSRVSRESAYWIMHVALQSEDFHTTMTIPVSNPTSVR